MHENRYILFDSAFILVHISLFLLNFFFREKHINTDSRGFYTFFSNSKLQVKLPDGNQKSRTETQTFQHSQYIVRFRPKVKWDSWTLLLKRRVSFFPDISSRLGRKWLPLKFNNIVNVICYLSHLLTDLFDLLHKLATESLYQLLLIYELDCLSSTFTPIWSCSPKY